MIYFCTGVRRREENSKEYTLPDLDLSPMRNGASQFKKCLNINISKNSNQDSDDDSMFSSPKKDYIALNRSRLEMEGLENGK